VILQLSEEEAEKFIEKVDFIKSDGLVPMIAQDASSDKVLTQAFMNREALKLTLTTGKMHYWSRKRKKIWLKGETSGHHSLVQNVILDCDNDALLFTIQQIGVCCHTGNQTCFHKPMIPEKEKNLDARILERIFEVIKDRIKNPRSDSYISKITAKGEDAVLQKIGEEATELILAVKSQASEAVAYEATDLIFHMLTLFAQRNMELKEIFKELERRHLQKTQRS